MTQEAKIKLRLDCLEDYIVWKEREFVPTERRLEQMKAEGFKFPNDVVTVNGPKWQIDYEDLQVPHLPSGG